MTMWSSTIRTAASTLSTESSRRCLANGQARVTRPSAVHSSILSNTALAIRIVEQIEPACLAILLVTLSHLKPFAETKKFRFPHRYGFGWAVQGFAPDTKQALAMPASLHIDPWKSEPDTRSGKEPAALKGTLTVSELIAGTRYAIYRWDRVPEAFSDYSDQYKRTSFTAVNGTFVYVDAKPFQSNGTTYYRALKVEE